MFLIVPYNTPIDVLQNRRIKGIILSGGPASVYDVDAPKLPGDIFNQKIPILGICYGLQLIISVFDGQVVPAIKREYGDAELDIIEKAKLFKQVPHKSQVWMSHGDKVLKLSSEFRAIAATENSPFAAVQHVNKPIYGLQFHPEVEHTEFGIQFFKNFIKLCEKD